MVLLLLLLLLLLPPSFRMRATDDGGQPASGQDAGRRSTKQKKINLHTHTDRPRNGKNMRRANKTKSGDDATIERETEGH
jgi:hypothetical protein